MTALTDESGHVLRTAEATARLLDLIEHEHFLDGFTHVTAEAIPWGATSLYFTGRWSHADIEALLKVGVSAAQRFWSATIADRDPSIAPAVLASGDRLGGAEIRWVLMERLPGGLHPGWGGAKFGLLMDAGARFQQIARTLDAAPASDVTITDVRAWISAAGERDAPGPIDRLLDRVTDDWRFITTVCDVDICHGDLHMANALMRVPAPDLAPALLIDFEPCRMPWLFDAAYPQILNSDPARPGWHDMVRQLADRRLHYGLPVCTDADLSRASAIALAWYAARMWGVLGAAPDPSWRSAEVWRQLNQSYITDGAAA